MQDARKFWIQQGFAEAVTQEAQQLSQLATYPGKVRYMVRRMG